MIKLNKKIKLVFKSSIADVKDINKSFALAKMHICYPGENRNGCPIDKESIERAIPTAYNCPVVCNYDIDEDTIGGHDSTFVMDEDGNFIQYNLTDGVGVVPESADFWWEDITEDDGVVNPYLTTQVILWKRAPVYDKILRDGVAGQSMEINVTKGEKTSDGKFKIDDFYFTAFCLLGDSNPPCFQSADVGFFDNKESKLGFSAMESLSVMMAEFKKSISEIQSSINEVNVYSQRLKGGLSELDKKIKLIEKFGLKVEDLDFNLEEISYEELEAKYSKEPNEGSDMGSDGESNPKNPKQDENVGFGLNGIFEEELRKSLYSQLYTDEYWGEMPRYSLVDYDTESEEVYCYDRADWTLLGMKYAKDGDKVNIDFNSSKRKKFVIVDFVDGNSFSFEKEIFENMTEKFSEVKSNLEAKSAEYSALEQEVSELREFKSESIKKDYEVEKKNLFEKFTELDGIEAFEDLKSSEQVYEISELEDKCFAIKGRNLNFTKKTPKGQESIKIPTPTAEESKAFESQVNEDSVYGGVFEKYKK